MKIRGKVLKGGGGMVVCRINSLFLRRMNIELFMLKAF
jgi:hypothetical protein